MCDLCPFLHNITEMSENLADFISISRWNVNGLGQKNRDEIFLEHIKYDINIMLETWNGDCPNIKIPNFDSFSKFRS